MSVAHAPSGACASARGDHRVGGREAGIPGAVHGREIVQRARLAGEEQPPVDRGGERRAAVRPAGRGIGIGSARERVRTPAVQTQRADPADEGAAEQPRQLGPRGPGPGGGGRSISRPCATAMACKGLRSAECSQPQPRSSAAPEPSAAVQARPPSRVRASTIRHATPAARSRLPAAIPAAPPPTITTSLSPLTVPS